LDRFMNSPPKELFKIFYKVYVKENDYDLNSIEGIRKYKIFKENLEYIKKENSNEENSYKLGITPFADLTSEEFREKYLIKPERIEEVQTFLQKDSNISEDFFDRYADSDESLDDKKIIQERNKIDWSSYFGFARNQGKCGSAWAFAASGAVEAVRKISYGGKNIQLSTQQLVDCVEEAKGCSGGSPVDALKYAANVGLTEDSVYPYKGKNQTCDNRVLSNSKKFQVKSYLLCGNDCTDERWYNLLIKGPLIVSLDASSRKFQHYILGVIYITASECKEKNHSVVVKGWDRRIFLSKDEYIALRNSWGLLWGEGGNFRIAYQPIENKTCFITSDAILPIV
jgi:C1A family cysteine protease